jgi:hypothetical protein
MVEKKAKKNLPWRYAKVLYKPAQAKGRWRVKNISRHGAAIAAARQSGRDSEHIGQKCPQFGGRPQPPLSWRLQMYTGPSTLAGYTPRCTSSALTPTTA